MARLETTTQALPIRCPNCEELACRGVLAVEGSLEPSNETMTTLDAENERAELQVIDGTRITGLALTHIVCDSCQHTFLPNA